MANKQGGRPPVAVRGQRTLTPRRFQDPAFVGRPLQPRGPKHSRVPSGPKRDRRDRDRPAQEVWTERFFGGLMSALVRRRKAITVSEMRLLNTLLPEAIRAVMPYAGLEFKTCFQEAVAAGNEHGWTLGHMALSHACRLELVYVDTTTRTIRGRALDDALCKHATHCPPEVHEVLSHLEIAFELLKGDPRGTSRM